MSGPMFKQDNDWVYLTGSPQPLPRDKFPGWVRVTIRLLRVRRRDRILGRALALYALWKAFTS